jgi:hypothetical protein
MTNPVLPFLIVALASVGIAAVTLIFRLVAKAVANNQSRGPVVEDTKTSGSASALTRDASARTLMARDKLADLLEDGSESDRNSSKIQTLPTAKIRSRRRGA